MNGTGAPSYANAMVAVHHGQGTWQQKVTRHIVLSEFSRRKFIEGGLSPERIIAKPNLVHADPKPKNKPDSYALYVGRLSEEKGPVSCRQLG